MQENARFATYCPYCQIATAPPPASSTATTTKTTTTGKAAVAASPPRDLLPPDLRPPPPYRQRAASAGPAQNEPPPPYSAAAAAAVASTATAAVTAGASEKDAPVLHYLDHDRDTVASLSLRYNVPADALRRANRLAADHLLQARRVIQIPVAAAASAAVSLSPQPVEAEDETRRKAAIRRFMVACKVSDYDLAVLYLEQTAWRDEAAGGGGAWEYDLRAAVEMFEADESWEKAHPIEAAKKKKTAGKQSSSRAGRRGGSGSGGFFSRPW